MSGLWKEAATVMLVRRSQSALLHPSKQKFNYKVLMLERSIKSTFMPSAYVFPGGRIANIDCDLKWGSLLGEAMPLYVESNGKYGLPLFFDSSVERSPMLTNSSSKYLDKDISFRLCAIRETFEESGILLFKAGPNFNENQKIDKVVLKNWRKIVNDNDDKFFDMCENLQIVPDIWSTYEWSNWLTPTNLDVLHGNRRYDTIFYMSFLDKAIEAEHDEHEIVASKWYHPADILKDHYEEKLWLAPPQVYEFMRLFNKGMGDYDNLKQFAEERAVKNCVRWLPVRMNCTDGIISVLPGDDLYPTEPDIGGLNPEPEIPHSMEESRRQCKHLHRMEFKSFHDCSIVCNVDVSCGHLIPAV